MTFVTCAVRRECAGQYHFSALERMLCAEYTDFHETTVWSARVVAHACEATVTDDNLLFCYKARQSVSSE